MRSLDGLYDAYERIEQEFQEELDRSLSPRGPDMLFDVVGGIGLPHGASAIDIGCGKGRHSIELARRFGLRVLGIDPVERHVELSRAALEATGDVALSSRVRFELGAADSLPVPDVSVDLIWCSEVVALVPALPRAFAEFSRVLRVGGRALVYQVLSTDRLESREAVELWQPVGVLPENAEPNRIESAMVGAGLRIDECIVIASEWGERAEETKGAGTRRLLHAARLLRSPEQYIERFGRTNYEVMLSDCLWHVYRMIGKLSSRAYILSKPR